MFGTSKSSFSRRRYCKNRLVMEIVVKELRYRFLVFAGCIGSRFSDFFDLGNKLGNERIFSEKREGPKEADLGTLILSVFGPYQQLNSCS